jgi:hypothetical protein
MLGAGMAGENEADLVKARFSAFQRVSARFSAFQVPVS